MIFKKFLLCSVMCASIGFLSNLVQAQTMSDTLTPQAGDKQVTFGALGNSGLLVYKKHKSNKQATRIFLSGNYSVSSNPINYGGNPYWGKLHNKEYNYYVGLGYGFQYRIVQFKKFEPYYGVDFELNSQFNSYENYDFYMNSSYSAPHLIKNTTKGGVSIGVSALPFIGFNYYIFERLAIGAEYRVRLINASWNSGQSSNYSQIDSDGNVSYNDNIHTKSGYKLDGGFSGYGAVTASIFLNKQK